jgi:hypothetical protein
MGGVGGVVEQNASSTARPGASAAGRPGQFEETRLADGIVRVKTAWGTTYCLKMPPEYAYASGGAVPGMAVPTNCP